MPDNGPGHGALVSGSLTFLHRTWRDLVAARQANGIDIDVRLAAAAQAPFGLHPGHYGQRDHATTDHYAILDLDIF